MLNNEEKIALYLIEGGPMMELVKHHIAERDRVSKMKIEILAQLDLDPKKVEVWARSDTGQLTAVRIPKDLKLPKTFVQANWTKPDSKGRRMPKKKTEEHAIFYAPDAHYTPQAELIGKKLNVPCSIGYKSSRGEGWTRIGRMLNECGFLWLHKEHGPFAFWIPDVKACVKEMKEQHKGLKSFKLLENVEDWKLNVDGVRPMLEEEWELMVAQKNLEEAQEAATKKAVAA